MKSQAPSAGDELAFVAQDVSEISIVEKKKAEKKKAKALVKAMKCKHAQAVHSGEVAKKKAEAELLAIQELKKEKAALLEQAKAAAKNAVAQAVKIAQADCKKKEAAASVAVAAANKALDADHAEDAAVKEKLVKA